MTFTHHAGVVYLRGRRLSDDEARGMLAIYQHELGKAPDEGARRVVLETAADLIRARVGASLGRAL